MEESAGWLGSSLRPKSVRTLRPQCAVRPWQSGIGQRSHQNQSGPNSSLRPCKPTGKVQKQQSLLFLVSNKYQAYLFTPRSQERASKISFKFFWWYKANWTWGSGTQIDVLIQTRKMWQQGSKAPRWRETKFKCPFFGGASLLLLYFLIY